MFVALKLKSAIIIVMALLLVGCSKELSVDPREPINTEHEIIENIDLADFDLKDSEEKDPVGIEHEDSEKIDPTDLAVEINYLLVVVQVHWDVPLLELITMSENNERFTFDLRVALVVAALTLNVVFQRWRMTLRINLGHVGRFGSIKFNCEERWKRCEHSEKIKKFKIFSWSFF